MSKDYRARNLMGLKYDRSRNHEVQWLQIVYAIFRLQLKSKDCRARNLIDFEFEIIAYDDPSIIMSHNSSTMRIF